MIYYGNKLPTPTVIVALHAVLVLSNFQDSVRAIQQTVPPDRLACPNKAFQNTGLCKPCLCDPAGSESQSCDQSTRRCSCRLGYAGVKCNKCSYGHVNVSTTYRDEHVIDQSSSGWQCKTCGPCFESWHQDISQLKEHAVDLIKRASEFESTLVKRLHSAKETSPLDTLDASIQTIGDRILQNKQASDQINLLGGELVGTIEATSDASRVTSRRQMASIELEPRLEELDYRLNVQSELQANLNKLAENYRDELLAIQEFMPMAALRLIRTNRNRTREALRQISDHHSRSSPAISNSVSYLGTVLSRVKYSHRQMHYIGSMILNETMDRHPGLTPPSYNEEKHIGSLDLTAQAIAELDVQLFDGYQANYDQRSAEMSATRKQIEEAKIALLRAGEQLNSFESNCIAIGRIASSLSGAQSSDYEGLIERASQIARSSLDKIDVKWPAAQAELADLTLKVSSINETAGSMLSNLAIELNKSISENLVNLMTFKQFVPENDVLGVISMKNRTGFLVGSLENLGMKLTRLSELKDNTTQLNNLTRCSNDKAMTELGGLNRTMFDSTSNANQIESQPRTGKPDHPVEALRTTTRALVSESKYILEKVRTYHSESFEIHLSLNGSLSWELRNLNNITGENKRLSRELSARVDASSKIRDGQRLANIVTELREISLFLQRNLIETASLGANFVQNELTFAEQRKTIEFLHREIGEDLECS